MTRLTIAAVITFILISLIFAGLSSAQIDPTTAVGIWLFDKSSGATAKDSSGNGNDGTLENNPKWLDGKFGKALSFDGVDDYVGELGNFGQPNTVTISLWFKTTEASWDTLFGQTNNLPPNSCTSYISVFAVKDTGVLLAELWTGSIGEIATSFTVRDGQWHQAVMVGKVNTQSLYVDGNLIGSRSGPISQGWWLYSFIGTGFDTTGRVFPTTSWHYFNGLIDEVVMFNVALETSDIQAIMTGFGDVEPAGQLATTWASIKSQF